MTIYSDNTQTRLNNSCSPSCASLLHNQQGNEPEKKSFPFIQALIQLLLACLISCSSSTRICWHWKVWTFNFTLRPAVFVGFPSHSFFIQKFRSWSKYCITRFSLSLFLLPFCPFHCLSLLANMNLADNIYSLNNKKGILAFLTSFSLFHSLSGTNLILLFSLRQNEKENLLPHPLSPKKERNAKFNNVFSPQVTLFVFCPGLFSQPVFFFCLSFSLFHYLSPFPFVCIHARFLKLAKVCTLSIKGCLLFYFLIVTPQMSNYV